jgi:hypothetical protein
LAIAMLAAAALMASCTTPRGICDYAADAGTFAGRVEQTHGSAVSFRVERLQQEATSARTKPHSPIAGQVVVVRYEKHEEQFLRVGQRYLVRVWWIGHYFSGVHMANHACSTGTVHADGSAIDTALVHQTYVRRVLYKILIAGAGVGLLVAAWALRKRRRQRRNVEELLRTPS